MTIERAIELAARHHAGQLHGNGPYIFHPLRVMFSVPEECQVVAVLHDVLEDTAIDRSKLMAELSVAEWDALNLLTRTEDESYSEYLLRVTTAGEPGGGIARTVKRADIADHLAFMTPEFSSLEPRYRKALRLLG